MCEEEGRSTDPYRVFEAQNNLLFKAMFATERCCSLANTVFDSTIVLDYDLFVLQGHGHSQPHTDI